MHDDISKTIIRVIHDYCFNNSAPNFCNEFSLSICHSIQENIKSKTMNLSKFLEITKKRKDFYIANSIDKSNDFTKFNKGLYKKLGYELSFCNSTSLLTSLKLFKRKMENGNSRSFPKGTTEDMLRSTLLLFLYEEAFSEPRSGAGNCDIIVPSEKVIIETKIWKGEEYYNSGFPELNDYIKKNNYDEGYYVIFNYNQTENKLIKENGEIFEKEFEGKKIHILFINMNAIRPSKIYRENKKRSNS
jgi:hypothetical protein